MDKEYLELLLKKHREETLNRQQHLDLDNWYLNRGKSSLPLRDAALYNRLLNEMDLAFPFEAEIRVRKTTLWTRIAVAAAAVAIMLGLWFYTSRLPQSNAVKDRYANDLKPGGNKATLTLANGKVINLSDAKRGIVVGEQLSYNDNTPVIPYGRDEGRSGTEMTLSTPRGGVYQLTLSDGTKVWLNAASSLTYAYGRNEGGQRRVKLHGEAYFEVAKDKKRPFIVESRGQQVEVLGTHFNINSYPDEPATKTTLLEGSVRLSVFSTDAAFHQGDKIQSAILKPNQQAVLSGNTIKVKAANLEMEMAWKNGDFLFDGEDFRAAMRKVARWYDVEIVYDSQLPQRIKLGGWVSRNKNISAVLKVLESTGEVHFKVTGRRVIVEK
jgi:ferric-dicitrate binding protein FerR (iron transport regulator)